MRLTIKIIAVFLLGITALAVANGYLAVRLETSQFYQQTEAAAVQFGRVMEPTIQQQWRERGDQMAISWVRTVSAGQNDVAIRWVWFDAEAPAAHRPHLSSDVLAARATSQTTTITMRDASGSQFVCVYLPMVIDDQPPGGLEFTWSMDQLDAVRQLVIWQNISAAFVAVVLGGLVLTVIGITMIGQPLNRLIDKTRRIAAGDLSQPVELRSNDELAELAESINQMCVQLQRSNQRVVEEMEGRVQAVEQLRHVDRLRTVGRLASGLAHELGTPLNVVTGRAELIASGKLKEGDLIKSADTIRAEAKRMTGIIRQLLDFARPRPPERVDTSLDKIIEQTFELVRPLAAKRNVELEFIRSEKETQVAVDPAQMQQVVLNLVINAAQAMPDGGTVQVQIGRTEQSPPNRHDPPQRRYLSLEVRDQGGGISPDDIDHIFEPFFTTKEIGEGTGLGLSVSYGIVQEHGGWIDVDSTEGEGSCFTVFIPLGES